VVGECRLFENARKEVCNLFRILSERPVTVLTYYVLLYIMVDNDVEQAALYITGPVDVLFLSKSKYIAAKVITLQRARPDFVVVQ
jgi:hypothetical protein